MLLVANRRQTDRKSRLQFGLSVVVPTPKQSHSLLSAIKQLCLTLYFWPMICNCEQAWANLSQTVALGCGEAWIGFSVLPHSAAVATGERERDHIAALQRESPLLVLECHAEMKSELLATTKLEI